MRCDNTPKFTEFLTDNMTVTILLLYGTHAGQHTRTQVTTVPCFDSSSTFYITSFLIYIVILTLNALVTLVINSVSL